MRIPKKNFPDDELAIFSIDAIHREHWNAFCDVCYAHFEFEEEGDGERTYEQKYDTFRRCYNFAKQHFKWNEVLWFKVGQQDFERLKKAYNLFLHLTTDDNAAVPMLLVMLRMQQSIWNRLKKDSELMEYVYPRHFNVDYSQYSIDHLENFPKDENLIKDLGQVEHQIIDALYKERPWDEEWCRAIEGAEVHHVDEWQGEKIEWDESAGSLTQMLAASIIQSYNHSIYEFSSKHYHTVTEGEGSAVKALVFRLFTSFQISLPEIKTLLDDYPESLWFEKLDQTRDELISEFKQTRLGRHWCECITSRNGLDKVGRYLINHRDCISEDEEALFFFQLDKICIITDILRGNASKYWLNIEYEYDVTQPVANDNASEVGQANPVVDAIHELTDVVKKSLEEPRIKVYPQADSTTNIGCDQKNSDFKTYLPEAAAPDSSAMLESNKEG